MDLKLIKDIRQKLTKARLHFTAPVGGIEKAFQESKNISWAQKRGHLSEIKVIEYYKWNHNCQCIARRLRTPLAELDLLLLNPQGSVIIVEVKSVTSHDFWTSRLTKIQRRRLFLAAQYIEGFLALPLEVRLAFVNLDGKIVLDLGAGEF